MRRKILYISIITLIGLTGCNEVILHELDEIRANRVSVILHDAGIKALKQQEGSHWKIAVKSNQTASALKVLDESRLFNRDMQYLKQDQKGFVQSKEERQRNIERQLAWSLEQTLEAFPGVLEARVHFHYEDSIEIDLLQKKQNNSASVLLVTSKDILVPGDKVKSIISGASGIEPKAISVVLSPYLAVPSSGKSQVSDEKVSIDSVNASSVTKTDSLEFLLSHRNVIIEIIIAVMFFAATVFIFCSKKSKKVHIISTFNKPENANSSSETKLSSDETPIHDSIVDIFTPKEEDVCGY